jgi:SAM-dependent methyltransferase
VPDRDGQPYYRADLARVHHLGFGFHADLTAPGILRLLEPVRERGGLVLELGCGTGLLTRYLVDAGHRVVATDTSPAMLEIARGTAPGAAAIEQLTLPDDPLPEADAIVSVGHAISYLPDPAAIERAMVAIAGALRPGGVVAFDICDLAYAVPRVGEIPRGFVGEDWALVTVTSVPTPDRFVREMAIFTRNHDGSWRRDDERHDNILIDTTSIAGLFAAHGVEVTVGDAFGDEELPPGLRTVVGRRP